TVTDAVPAGTTFVSGSSSSACTLATGTVTCSSTGLTFGGTDQTFTVVLHVSSGYAGSTLANTATFGTRATSDVNAANDTSTVTVGIARAADLAVTKTAATDPVTAGNNETYTITVHNNGPSDAGAYTVTDAVPAGTTFVSGSSSSACT